MQEISRNIETLGKDTFEVWISAEVTAHNADHCWTEWEVWGIDWNKLIYSDYANELIKKHIEDNWNDIEDEFIERYLKSCEY